MIAKHHKDRWTKIVSNWNPAISTKHKGYWTQGRAKLREDDLNTIRSHSGLDHFLSERALCFLASRAFLVLSCPSVYNPVL